MTNSVYKEEIDANGKQVTRMKCANRKRCGFLLAFGYCVKALGEHCANYKAGGVNENEQCK